MPQLSQVQLTRRGRAQALIISIVASLLVLLPTTPFSANASGTINLLDNQCDLSGSGSSVAPYLVSDSDSLYETPDCSGTGKFFLLTADIDLSSSTNLPIGYSASGTSKRFEGTLDGGAVTKYRIFNIAISTSSLSPFVDDNGSTSDGVGLFWRLGLEDAGDPIAITVFQNLTLEGTVTYLGGATTVSTGAFVGTTPNRPITFSNVIVDVAVTGKDTVGGFVGEYQGSGIAMHVISSSFTGTVSGDLNLGGLVGNAIQPVFVDGFTNTGLISTSGPTGQNVGGLIGQLEDGGTFSDIVNHGRVIGLSRTGGIVGTILSADFLEMVSISNQATISAGTGTRAGGLIGQILAGDGDDFVGSISSSENAGAVTAGSNAAGLVGYVAGGDSNNLSIFDSVNRGQISGQSAVGGFVGYFAGAPDPSELSIEESSNEAPILGTQEYVGGMVGRVANDALIDITSVTNSGSVTSANNYYVGGLVGILNKGGSISNAKNLAVIDGKGHTGGLVGRLNSSTAALQLTSVSNQATVSVGPFGDNAGGILGSADGTLNLGSVENQASVTGYENIGGILGSALGTLNLGSVENAGSVSGDESIGGIAGIVGDPGGSGTTVTMSLVTNSGTVNASGNLAGGVFGLVSDGVDLITLSQIVNSGAITGNDYVGGLAGRHRAGSLKISYFQNSGVVQGGFDVGGIVGRASNTIEVFQARVLGLVQGTDKTGGAIGNARDITTLSEVYVSAQIVGDIRVGGLIGYVSAIAQFSDSLVDSAISASGGQVGGILGDTGAPLGMATFSNVLFAGSFDVPTRSAIGAIYGGDGVDGQSFASASYWALSANSNLTAAAPSAAFTAIATSFLDTQSSLTAASYQGWNFVSVWGFGGCSVNNGLPMLRFADASATSQTAVCIISQGPSAPIGPTRPYEGPVIQSISPTVGVGQPATVTGIRLNTITEVFVGGQKASFTISEGILTFIAPTLKAGAYQLIFVVPSSQLSLFGSIEVLPGSAPVVVPESLGKVNVGSFNGKLVVYAANLEGSRISWKVGGRWGRAIANSDFARFDRPTPRRGVQVTVQIFVDGELQLTKVVRTR